MSSINSLSSYSTVLPPLTPQPPVETPLTVESSAVGPGEATRNVASAVEPNRLADPVEQASRVDVAVGVHALPATPLTDLRTNLDTALQSARVDGTDPGTAIDAVLSDAGVDLVAFHRELDPLTARANGTDGQSLGLAPDAPLSPDATDETATDGIAPVDAVTATGATSALDDLLSGTGVDPASFESSLASILNSNNNETATPTDTAPLFAAATVGSSLDIAG